MKPQEDFHNGGDECVSDSSSSGGEEEEVCVCDERALCSALGALNALRVARLHGDVTLAALGAELPAHAALLVAHAPALLGVLGALPVGAAVLRAPGVPAAAARQLLDYMYTGRLSARDVAEARALLLAAWRLHMDAAAACLARLLLTRALAKPDPNQALLLRALPDLPQDVTMKLDAYIRENFDEVCACEAMSSLPLVEIEMVRVTSSPPVRESPAAVAEAALQWLRSHRPEAAAEELAARPHQVYVDGEGAVRWCGDLPAPEPAAAGEELARWRSEALAAGADSEAGVVSVGRQPGAVWGVVAARGERGVAWAVAMARGALVRARVAGRALAGAGGAGLGAALAGRGGALLGGRCALGAGVVRGALLAAGGYTRGEVLCLAARLLPPPPAPATAPATALWLPAPPLPTPRARAAAASLHDRLYIVGGSDGHNELDTVDVYEEESSGAGSWRGVARIPLGRSHAGAAAVEAGAGGALYVVGGTAGGRTLRAVHRYWPATDRWSEAPPLGTGRSSCACVAWGGALWALGGCDEWRCVASTERLPLTIQGDTIIEGQWSAGPALPSARRSAGAAQWEGRLVLAGGSLGAASTTRVEWLTQEEPGSWRPGPPLRRARASLALVPMAGALYAAAGFDGKEFLSCVEVLYSPEGQWTLLTSATPAPERHLTDDLQVLSLNGDGNTGENGEEGTEQKREVKKEEIAVEKDIQREVIPEHDAKSEV